MPTTPTTKPESSDGAAAKEQIKGLSRMDTTKAIREVSDDVRAEYFAMTERLQKTEVEDRKERVRLFAARTWTAKAEKHFQEAIRIREQIHFDFMGKVWPESHIKHYGYPLPPDYPPHDHTKDELFAFLLAVRFDIVRAKLDEDKAMMVVSQKLVEHELTRHYTCEAHHPEYEQKTNNECQEKNILEMAIDRLARNVQFNHGEVSMDQMRKFLPKFHLGGEDKIKKKGEIYMQFVEEYQEFVSRRSKELYYDNE